MIETRVVSIGGGGAVGFFVRFTKPPVVVCQIIRNSHNAFNSRPVNFSVTYVDKDCFSYVARDNKPGDQVSWIAIGD